MFVNPIPTTLVDIGSYKLEMAVHGPPRQAHSPIVVIIPDIASSIKEWAAVTRTLAESMSVVNYERAGYGKSEAAPQGDTRSAGEIAMELHTLLRVAKITPPYIVICNGYGAVVLGEFLKLRGLVQFKGFVFLNANFGDTSLTLMNPSVQAMQKDIDVLKLCYGKSHCLSDLEWDALLEEDACSEHRATAESEIAKYRTSQGVDSYDKFSRLEKHDLRRVPLVVLHVSSAVDIGKICAEGYRIGDGTDADKATIRQVIDESIKTEEEVQRNLSQLSGRSKFQHVEGSGPKIQLTAPRIVADAVTWTLMEDQGWMMCGVPY
ncbi:alpha beta hydrolase [Fusarium heterosporum]|uniref:Alpha beta hydrolase n=1 Tax=Fusarium heterosporum TaxID=42747 RepID=A0A8H5TSQ4_FUSHE|nr:alpha beta hydrolase [Fusarium heterosporum]